VEALGVVDRVNESADRTPCVFDILEAAPIDFLGFECFRETLSFGVVVSQAGSC
jgi:hypothetical protein